MILYAVALYLGRRVAIPTRDGPMDIPVTRTKIILPRRRSDLLSRPRLSDLIVDLLDNKLTILAAPAGYGKTSLLVDVAHQTNIPFCWFSIDPLDRDIFRFVTYLIAAINQRFPDFGRQSAQVLQSLSPNRPAFDQLVTTMINEAYDTIHEHFAIVLDDYHLVDDQPEINQFLGQFVQGVDENCHIVVASRTLLSLPDLPLMVARSQVGGLSFEDLAFQPEEVRSLFQQNYQQSISESTAKEIIDQTEGWITGLLLSTQAKTHGMQDRSRLFRVSSVGLYDYLAQQVLDQQSAAVRDFLLRTSVLEEFDAELCASVFGLPPSDSETWAELMESIQRNNLFVLPVGEKGTWLRYHHLFRDFLQSRLSIENPGEHKSIQLRLADIYAKNGEWERAREIYLRLG
ncbi:MAG TPA: hypothetical protein VHO48_04495, partial [Anaerolineaceae bacterium]|nr:hypothetical protein [Anaerolineaceae bacterium]